MNNKDIERLCKRHMAKMLDKLRQNCGLTPDANSIILKEFSYLMDDLKQSRKKEGKDNVQSTKY